MPASSGGEMSENGEKLEGQSPARAARAWDLSDSKLIGFALLGLGLLIAYYFPCLSGQGDFYFSDIAFYFEPFAHFVQQEARLGILPLWNPYVYSGMSQVAVPSPGLFYPFSWLMFLMPFSAGLSIYMIVHQVLFGVGAYLYFRDLGSSRTASVLGAMAVALGAYSFSLVRNFTLPASMAWLPLALWCERRIDFGRSMSRRAAGAPGASASLGAFASLGASATGDLSGSRENAAGLAEKDAGAQDMVGAPHGRPGGTRGREAGSGLFPYVFGLVFSVAMIMYAGRPEVGAPELVLIGIACISKFLQALFKKELRPWMWQELFLKLGALTLGVALSLPMIGPVLDWTKVSPRATGMAPKWVFTWSSNWYDFLCLFLSQPMGDLTALNDYSVQLRALVSSRGSHVPFLTSTYISPVIGTLSIFGLFDRTFKQRWIVVSLLIGFIFMSAGNYTPFAPAIVSLSSFLATFRYPVKLLIFPAIILILLAVRGFDSMIEGRLGRALLAVVSAIWLVVLSFALILYAFPDIVIHASKLPWLFHGTHPRSFLINAEMLMAGSMLHAAAIGIATCATAFIVWRIVQRNGSVLKETDKGILNVCSMFLICLTAFCLLQSSIKFRQTVPFGFFEHPSKVARVLANTFSPATVGAFRVVNLYFDPLTVPKNYKARPGSKFEEDFFQYARELCLYKTVLDYNIPSSNGYEAAETSYYRDFFIDALQFCTQAKHEVEKRVSDLPMHRFAMLSATDSANTQCYRDREDNPIRELDPTLFEKVHEDRSINYRLYKVRNPRPRIYFADKIEAVESFDKLRAEFLKLTPISIDTNPRLCYLKSSDMSSGVPGSAGGSPAPNSAKTELVLKNDNGQSLSLTATTPTPRLLIIADHFFPGWIATIDNTPTTILQANIINRAILVPSGTHEIRMLFRPQSMTLGLTASTVSFFIFAIGLTLISKSKTLAQLYTKSEPAPEASSADSSSQ